MGARVEVRRESDRFLAPTSQFYFCSLPLRLDTYAGCGFGCTYCFAATRGGATVAQGSFKPTSLERRLARLETSGPRSVVDEFLSRRQPLHIGGMADPFPPQERAKGVTLNVLKTLARREYPAVISTKSDLFADPEYLAVLRDGRFFVQVSLSSADPSIAGEIERGTPSPLDRFAAIEAASACGVATSVRHQPVIPGRERDVGEVLERASGAGALHYGMEFLKLGIEDSDRQALLLRQLPGLADKFKSAVRSGREWLLPPEQRLPWVLQARERTHGLGMSFGAADTDLLPISDGNACCSGADLHLPGPTQFFTRNYLSAVRAQTRGVVSHNTLNGHWSPQRTVARFVNSDSRLPDPAGAPMGAYVDRNWNGRANGPSPAMFFGVTDSCSPDVAGFSQYQVADWLQTLMRSDVESTEIV